MPHRESNDLLKAFEKCASDEAHDVAIDTLRQIPPATYSDVIERFATRSDMPRYIDGLLYHLRTETERPEAHWAAIESWLLEAILLSATKGGATDPELDRVQAVDLVGRLRTWRWSKGQTSAFTARLITAARLLCLTCLNQALVAKNEQTVRTWAQFMFDLRQREAFEAFVRDLEISPQVAEIFRSIRNEIDETDFFVLATLERSGTHFARSVLVNYLGDEYVPFHLTMQNVADRRLYLHYPSEYKPAQFTIKNAPIRDFACQHSAEELNRPELYVMMLYRNPLDYLVSIHHFYDLAGERVYDPAYFVERLDYHLDRFIEVYLGVRGVKRSRRVFIASYEALMADTYDVFEQMLRQFGWPIHAEKLRHAIDVSTLKRAKSTAQELDNRYFRASLVPRSGDIGQWRAYFTPDSLAHVKKRLNEAGIALSEFQLDALPAHRLDDESSAIVAESPATPAAEAAPVAVAPAPEKAAPPTPAAAAKPKARPGKRRGRR